MENKKTKRKLAAFGMLAMAAGTVVPFNVLATEPGGGARDSLSGNVDPNGTESGGGTEAKATNQKTTITVQKLQYKKDAPINIKKGEKEDGSDTVGINNNGKEVTDFSKYKLGAEVENFNKTKYGDVQFSLFRLTKAGLEKEAADKTALTYDAANANGYFEAVADMQNVSVDDSGKVEFKDLPQGVYFIVETKHSTNLVVTPAEDMRVDLPRTNDEGTGYKNHLFLYPKNRVKDFTFTLTKFGEEFNKTDKQRLGVEYKDNTIKLEGITFELYKGEPGKGTKVGKDLVTNKDGQISVSENLTIGKYYFVEKVKEGVVGNTDADKNAEYVLSPYAQNDENNKMTFTITETGDIVTDMSLINYGKPHADKKLADEKKDTVIERGQSVDFDSLVKVPKDIAGVAANGTDRGAAPYFSFRYEDTLAKNLEFPATENGAALKASDIKLVVKEAGTENTLTENTDYRVSFEKGKFIIDFIVNTKGKETDEAAWKKNADSKVSDGVKALAGKKLEISYTLVANKDAKAGDKFVNHMDFFYNNQPNIKDDRVIKDETTSRTLGHKIVKIAAGPFGQGEDPKKPLKDAKFILIRDIGTDGQEDLEYFVGTIDTTGTKSIPVWKKLVGVTSEDDKKLDDRALHEKYIEATKGGTDGANSAYKFTTGEDGSITFDGLDKDYKYFVKEVKAPTGYQLIPGKIELKDISDKYENEKYVMGSQNIADKKSPEMPLTGSEKMLIGLGATVTITLLAGGYAVIQKKNRKEINVE